jgi:hypothetical protein
VLTIESEYKIDMPSEPRSLWEQLDSEVEPWRRGRMVLIVIALLNLTLQALMFAAGIVLGETEGLLGLAAVSVLFWLQFYFIWIGIDWIRWLAGAWSGLVGFAYFIWGWRDGNAVLIVFGCINLLIGTYLCLSPSVYFFAKRQQERRNWLRSLTVAAVFALLFVSFYFGSVGLFAYKHQLEVDAREYAEDAVRKLFTDHDTSFFLTNLAKEALEKNGGTEFATRFLQHATLEAGDVHDIEPVIGKLKLTYHFPRKLDCVGMMTTHGLGEHGRLQIYLRIVEFGRGWQITDVAWRYGE